MPLHISYRTINNEFQDKIKEISGQNVYKCFQCGACSTAYRKKGDYKIYSGLACQTVVEPDMYLTQ